MSVVIKRSVGRFVVGVIEDAYIVPVSISYDRLVDGIFVKEQMVRSQLSRGLISSKSQLFARVLCWAHSMGP